MRVSMSVLLLLGIAIGMMLRFRHKGDGLTLVEFLLCTAFGFLLATSSFAPTIRAIIEAGARAVSR
jgi:hypothetical protein